MSDIERWTLTRCPRCGAMGGIRCGLHGQPHVSKERIEVVRAEAQTERDRYQATLERIRNRYLGHGHPGMAMLAEWCNDALREGGG